MLILFISNQVPVTIPSSQDPHINTIGYAQHYVKFTIFPNQEGLTVTVKGEPATCNVPAPMVYCDPEVLNKTQITMIGMTDSNSTVTFPMDKTIKYYVTLPERHISVEIYPRDSEYKLYGRIYDD
jgi:hypothetical protein